MRTYDREDMRYTLSAWNDSNGTRKWKASVRHPATAVVGNSSICGTQDEAMESAVADLVRKLRHDGPVGLVDSGSPIDWGIEIR